MRDGLVNYGNKVIKLLIVIVLYLAYCTSNSYGIEIQIGAPTTVSTKWPDNENILNLSKWFDYLIFVGIVLVVIILVGILLEIIDFFVWCSRRACNCCGGHKLKKYDPYSGPGYSKKRVRCTGTLIILVFLVVLGAAGVFVAFNALFSLNLRKLVETGNFVIQGVNGTLEGVISATLIGLPKAISESTNIIKDVAISPGIAICESIGGVTEVLEDVEKTIVNMDSIIYEVNVTIPNQIIDISTRATQKITYKSENVTFPPSDTLESVSTKDFDNDISSALTSLGNALKSISNAKTSCLNEIRYLEGNLSSNSYFSKEIISTQNLLIEQVNAVTKTISPVTFFPVYVSYVNIGDSVRLAVELVIIASPLLFFLVVTIGICANKKFLFKAPACCLFFTFWLFFLISSLHIGAWIITNDLCQEIPKRQDLVVDLVSNLTGDQMSSFNIDIPTALNGVLNCKTNFLSEVLGGSENALAAFRKLTGLDSSLNSNIISLTSSISIGEGIGSELSSDTFASLQLNYSTLTSSAVSKFADFKQSLIDIKNDADSALNTSIAQHNDNSITRENIQSHCETVNTTSICDKYRDYVSASNQLDAVAVDMIEIDEKFDLMRSRIEVINSILNDIKTAPQNITNKADDIKNSANAKIESIQRSTSTIVETVLTNVLEVFTTALPCSYIPETIKKVDDQFCWGVVLDSIAIGVSSFVVGIMCAVGFILILLIDKYRTYELKIENKKEKPKKSQNKKPVDLLNQIELTGDGDNLRAKGAAPTLEEFSIPSYEESNGSFFY